MLGVEIHHQVCTHHCWSKSREVWRRQDAHARSWWCSAHTIAWTRREVCTVSRHSHTHTLGLGTHMVGGRWPVVQFGRWENKYHQPQSLLTFSLGTMFHLDYLPSLIWACHSSAPACYFLSIIFYPIFQTFVWVDLWQNVYSYSLAVCTGSVPVHYTDQYAVLLYAEWEGNYAVRKLEEWQQPRRKHANILFVQLGPDWPFYTKILYFQQTIHTKHIIFFIFQIY